MIKLVILAALLFVAYMYGQDHGLPEQRRIAALERRVLALEVQVKAQHVLKHALNPSNPTPETPVQP